MLPAPTTSTSSRPPERGEPLRRNWQIKLDDAYRGIKLGMRGHSSFSVQFFFAALITTIAVAVGCSAVEWCVLLGGVGFVMTAELFNSALAYLVRGLDEATRLHVRPCLDISAGAVLVASLVTAALGIIIFGSRLWSFFQHL